jgi:hypothetical protein
VTPFHLDQPRTVGAPESSLAVTGNVHSDTGCQVFSACQHAVAGRLSHWQRCGHVLQAITVVRASTDVANTASVRVLERLGFRARGQAWDPVTLAPGAMRDFHMRAALG